MIGQYPPIGLPTGRNRWVVRKPQSRTAVCESCRRSFNRLALYTAPGAARLCRSCVAEVTLRWLP
jgi:hypothetical protein